MKKIIKIHVTGGLEFNSFVNEALYYLLDKFEFINTKDKPEIVVFGPYGDSVPPKGDYLRIGYFCECMHPDLKECDWAFGVLYDEEVNSPKYKRIDWHGVEPKLLAKPNLLFTEPQKLKFCNFIYSNKIPYREYFFDRLSKYKKIDAPGKSRNNMLSFDLRFPDLNFWERKRLFMAEYKFTIAFENYSHPGYHTEKILDPMFSNSLPIYLGNPNIDLHFNEKSFINSHKFTKENFFLNSGFSSKILQTLKERRFITYNSISDKITRKAKIYIRNHRMTLAFRRSFDDLIDKIIELDSNDDLYFAYKKEPWLINNEVPTFNAMQERWEKIFNSI